MQDVLLESGFFTYPVFLSGFRELWLQGPCHSWTHRGNMYCYVTWSIHCWHQTSSLHLTGAQSHYVFSYTVSLFTVCFWNPWTQYVPLQFLFYLTENGVLLLNLKLPHLQLPLNFHFCEIFPWVSFEFYLNPVAVPCIDEGAWFIQRSGRSCCKCMSQH